MLEENMKLPEAPSGTNGTELTELKERDQAMLLDFVVWRRAGSAFLNILKAGGTYQVAAGLTQIVFSNFLNFRLGKHPNYFRLPPGLR